MNINIVCVGKLKEEYWRMAQAEYSKRLGAYCRLQINQVKESPTDDVEEEAEYILKVVEDRSHVILLDVNGKTCDSIQWASKISKLGVDGKSNLTFIIGGSQGVGKKIVERADERISFSQLTFPHQMMRVILLEQIYRGFKIASGEKYHK